MRVWLEYEELWADVPDYVGIYQVSNLGRLLSLARTVHHPLRTLKLRERVLQPILLDGQPAYHLCKDSTSVLVLVSVIQAKVFEPHQIHNATGNQLRNGWPRHPKVLKPLWIVDLDA